MAQRVRTRHTCVFPSSFVASSFAEQMFGCVAAPFGLSKCSDATSKYSSKDVQWDQMVLYGMGRPQQDKNSEFACSSAGGNGVAKGLLLAQPTRFSCALGCMLMGQAHAQLFIR